MSKSLSMGRVVLTVRDLNKVADWYQSAVGLHLIAKEGELALLGTPSEVLLELRQDKSARQRSRREAGLFHTAFLLPSRADLGRWIMEASARQTQVTGASDHEVSEAIYLDDPEGNGVEIYADRPASAWRFKPNGEVEMGTYQLDVADIVKTTTGGVWQGFPEGATIGHVHLQVGDVAQSEEFYKGKLGLDLMNRYTGANFYAADGYHHHIAANIWNSRGAGPREFPSTGLSEMEIRLSPERAEALRKASGVEGTRFTLNDPWGTPLVFDLM